MVTVGANNQTQLDKGRYKYGYLVKISLVVVTDINLTTASRNISWNGDTYIKAATLGVSGISEALKLQANDINISLSGITGTYIAISRDTKFIGGRVRLWQIFFSEVDDSILDDPILYWDGKIIESGFTHDWESKSAAISVTVGDYFSRFDSALGARTNPTEWKQRYPNDRIFDQIPNIASKEINF